MKVIFVFTLSDGTTKLSHEIEHYDSSTGEIIAWVNFPTLVAASSTISTFTTKILSILRCNDDYV